MIPPALHAAILHELDGVSLRDVRSAASALSGAYRGAARSAVAPLGSDAARLAYLVTRLPATFAAVEAALGEVRSRCPEFGPRTLLDLGAGPGTAAWAAHEVFPSLDTATLVERDPGFVALGRRLVADLPIEARWQHGDARSFTPGAPADLVILSYVAGEMTPGHADALVDAAWSSAGGVLVIVEPGTPAGHARVLAARSRLLAAAARIVAPCPHDRPCPLGAGDWCHVGVRLPRSREHRLVKKANLAYEDEKFSYIVATRGIGAPAAARVLRRPELHKGHVRLRLCAASGLVETTIGRSIRDAYRDARHARWGDGWR